MLPEMQTEDDDPKSEHIKSEKGNKEMNYEEFKDRFKEDIQMRLDVAGIDASISMNSVKKLNENYEAMTVTPEGSNIGVNIPVEKLFTAYENGGAYRDIVDKAMEAIEHGIEMRPEIDVNALADYSQMKEKLVMEVVSSEANKELLETVPHKDIEDMSVVYRFILNSDDTGRSSVLVTNRMIENMNVTPEQLHADALENAPQLKPVEIKGMSEVLAEIMGMDPKDMEAMFHTSLKDEQMYVATVPDKIHGAGVLAYQDFMDKAAERAGGDFFILPSSIHELLIVPDDGKMQLKDLQNMVRDVNATQVAPEDKLTDSVYHYDSKEKIFELGEKFVERQAQKEAEHAEDREADKGSVLGDLKAKKEEVAKAPKKEHVDKGAKAKGGEAI